MKNFATIKSLFCLFPFFTLPIESMSSETPPLQAAIHDRLNSLQQQFAQQLQDRNELASLHKANGARLESLSTEIASYADQLKDMLTTIADIKKTLTHLSQQANKSVEPYTGLLPKAAHRLSNTILGKKIISTSVRSNSAGTYTNALLNNPIADTVVLEAAGRTTQYILEKRFSISKKKATIGGAIAKTLLHFYAGHGNFGTKATTLIASFAVKPAIDAAKEYGYIPLKTPVTNI